MHQIASDFSKFPGAACPWTPLATPIYLIAPHTSFHFETPVKGLHYLPYQHTFNVNIMPYFLAPAVTVGETEGAMNSTSVFFLPLLLPITL